MAKSTGYLWPHSWQNLGSRIDEDALTESPLLVPAGDDDDGDDSGGREESDEELLDARS